MKQNHAFNILLGLLSISNIFNFAMGSPVDPLTNLQCHCITFWQSSYPTACTLPASQNLDFTSAHQLASAEAIPLEFASDMTIEKLLEVEAPLPTAALLRMSAPASPIPSGSKIVCGMGEEVKRLWMAGFGVQDEQLRRVEQAEIDNDVYMSTVMSVLVLLLILYAVGEFVWLKVLKKGGAGEIRLEGDEKNIQAASKVTSWLSDCDGGDSESHLEDSWT